MLRSTFPTFGVHNLWKSVESRKFTHSGGFRTLQKYCHSNDNNNNSIAFPIRVGVDANNLLHSLVRKTDLVKLLLRDDPSELCKVALHWARRTHQSILYGDRPIPLVSPSSYGEYFGGEDTRNNNNNNTHQTEENEEKKKFEPFRTKDFGSEIVASFSPSSSSSQQQQQQNRSSFNESRTVPLSRTNFDKNCGCIFVFDGETPPSKILLRKERHRRRERVLSEAALLASYGESLMANKVLSSAPSVLPKHILAVSDTLVRHGFTVLHAPYESEAQLSFLAEKGYIDAILSSDSDCVAFHPESTIFRLKSAREFDVYDLGKKFPALAKIQPQTETDDKKQQQEKVVNTGVSSSFHSQLQSQLDRSRNIIISEQEKYLIDKFLDPRQTPREIFTFCCCASGSDYNSGAGESLPGNALSIFAHLMSLGSHIHMPRFGLNYFEEHNNHNNNNFGENNTSPLQTTRDACERLLLPPALCLSLGKAVFSILQHLVYDPELRRIVSYLPQDQVSDLRKFLQTQMLEYERTDLVESDVLGPRTPPVASVSDYDWCEKFAGAQYRAAMSNTSNVNSNNAVLKHSQTCYPSPTNSLNPKQPNTNNVSSSSSGRIFGKQSLFEDEENAEEKKMLFSAEANKNNNHSRTTNMAFADDYNNNPSIASFVNNNNSGMFFCDICKVAMQNVSEMETHLKGKRHLGRSKIQQHMTK